MELEVGMYVRTKRDGIGKIISLSIGEEDECCFIELSKRRTGIKEHNILKARHNIKDLIEDGDYVNGEKVWDYNGKLYVGDYEYGEYLEKFEEWGIKIETIVTRECFENVSYKVEDK